MPAAAALMQSLLGPQTSLQAAKAALEKALLINADPLHWCAIHLGVSDAEVMRRAAAWMDLTFFDVVPRGDQSALELARLEHLADVRVYRARQYDRDIAFAAPDFFGLLRLAEARASKPDLLNPVCLVPGSALRQFLVEGASGALIDNARQNLTRFWPRAAAQLELTVGTRHLAVVVILALAIILLAAPLLGLTLLIPLWSFLVLAPAVLRLVALQLPSLDETAPEIGSDPADLPLYSVLVPLRDEANMVDQLHTWLGKLDYPPEKLEIIFVVEEASPQTMSAVRRYRNDARFSMLVVPDAAPKTKPKALDFALPLCRGEYLVVYDAEDRPDAAQLRRAAAMFLHHPDLICVQARLVIDNGGKRFLPSLFAGEYAGLFAVLLPALARWGLVVPLGGSSNHFRTAALRTLGGWDPYNVTEDADLGVRIARKRLRCATLSSPTYEAAPTNWRNWLGQRTRWMKGWLQTYVVHTRHPDDLLRDLGWLGALMFQVVLMGMLLAPLLYAGFLLVLVYHGLTGQLAWPHLQPWPLACLAVLLIGNGCAIATNIVGLTRTKQKSLAFWQALVPFYWLLVALATLRAMREFAIRPFHWFKTPHHEAPQHNRTTGIERDADPGRGSQPLPVSRDGAKGTTSPGRKA